MIPNSRRSLLNYCLLMVLLVTGIADLNRKYVFYAKQMFGEFLIRQSGNFQSLTWASLQPVSFSLATS